MRGGGGGRRRARSAATYRTAPCLTFRPNQSLPVAMCAALSPTRTLLPVPGAPKVDDISPTAVYALDQPFLLAARYRGPTSG